MQLQRHPSFLTSLNHCFEHELLPAAFVQISSISSNNTAGHSDRSLDVLTNNSSVLLHNSRASRIRSEIVRHHLRIISLYCSSPLARSTNTKVLLDFSQSSTSSIGTAESIPALPSWHPIQSNLSTTLESHFALSTSMATLTAIFMLLDPPQLPIEALSSSSMASQTSALDGDIKFHTSQALV